MTSQAGLFGITNSNRNFALPEHWSKNKFNSSFPVALACYMFHQSLQPVYLSVSPMNSIVQGYVSVQDLFGLEPLQPTIHFGFEQPFAPYNPFVIETIPRIDVVIQDLSTPRRDSIRALEIKLTALPDNTTCELGDKWYGSELVVRPDTIVYVCLSIANWYSTHADQAVLHQRLAPTCTPISDWTDIALVKKHLPNLLQGVRALVGTHHYGQLPLLVQPIWKTQGKSSILADNCFDIFVWSNLAIAQLMVEEAESDKRPDTFKRIGRSVVWLMKMLWDFANNGKINYRAILDHLSYDTKNDKAFAISGRRTHHYMTCPELTHPRIHKTAVGQIILGNGQRFLSPERRLDAILVNSPDLFM
ncbi:MAG: HindVP family restriction endonuclease [Chloroflexaceae bacterium]|nr:HindVP family restriction endonuclease [Chloroflexaceae bacterium]